MFAALTTCDGGRGGFGIVHLLTDLFSVPGGFDARVEGHDVEGSFADMGGVEEDVVVVEVEDHGDVESRKRERYVSHVSLVHGMCFLLFADGEQIMHRPANIIVLEYQSFLYAIRELGIVLPESIQCLRFPFEDSTHV